MGQLVQLMTGGDQMTGEAAKRVERRAPGEPVLEARSVRLRPSSTPFDFTIRAGELVGLAGLEGMGQEAFLHGLRGASRVGDIRLLGDRPRVIDHRHKALRYGIVYVPRERRAEALFDSLSIRGNFALPTLADDATAGLVRPGSTERRFRPWIERLGIKLRSSKDDVGTLSGGNQQKVVLARWLAARPRVLLLNDPTRGVDVGAKHDIYELLVGLAGEGISVVMLSTEIDEHVELMDRVLVFREHELSAEFTREQVTRGRLVHAFFGRETEEDAA